MTVPSQNLYGQLCAVVDATDSEYSAADAHGMLCGLFCTANKDCYPLWKQELILPDTISEQQEQALKAVYTQTYNQFFDEEFSLQPLLPDDAASITSRSAALGEWCQGLLLGMSLGGVTDFHQYSNDIRQFIVELTEFSRVDPNQEESEENEQAYTEIVEYTRIGVQTILKETFELMQNHNSNRH